MKKFNSLLATFLLVFVANGQQNFTLYPMVSIPQSNYMNPATLPDAKWHFGFPGLNSTYLQYSNGGFSLNKIFSAMEPSGKDSFKLNVNKLLDIMSEKNYIALKVENTWLHAGFKFGNHYFNFNATEKAHLRVSLPKDLFRFLIDGNGGANLGETFKFNFKAGGIHYREYGLGYNYSLDKKFNIGGRVKFLQGFNTIDTRKAQLDITTNKEDYSLLLKADLEVNTASAWGTIVDTAEGNFEPGSFAKTGNRGLGLDLGMSFQLNDRVSFSASVIDLGFINWQENAVSIKSSDPNATFKFDGIHISSADTQEFDQYIEEIIDSVLHTFRVDTVQGSFRTALSTEFFLYGSYVLNDHFKAGALFYGDFYNKRFYPGLTLNILWKAGRALSINLTNTMYNRSWLNVGLGVSANAGPVQVYSVMDNVLAPFAISSLKTLSWRFGTNFTFGREKMKAPKPVDPLPPAPAEPAPTPQ
jgi:hypothetical protein